MNVTPDGSTLCKCDCGHVHVGELSLVLTETGDRKINVIKEVRTLTNLGLKEAKEIVDRVSSGEKVVVPITQPSVHRIKNARGILEGVGATVEILDARPLDESVVDSSRELLAQLV